ncbi:DUF397 domain-containing protein [Actinoalloteichus fjordicus]|uniref:DUF397 family protein n=1 Tax=Actinoalloteichus fjordicus TaxID=1612552 RepID=A0AAC9PQJ2_9PSEU|nr:DUF397 domain-containing protein [Actinoalloteichus fjordicus]APU12982.1 putative DUF397 family protein [Actinoalloteichus fjordicus]
MTLRWKKSARSTANTNCVEIGYASNNFLIRDTKNRDGGMLSVSGAEFFRFIGLIKARPLSGPR